MANMLKQNKLSLPLHNTIVITKYSAMYLFQLFGPICFYYLPKFQVLCCNHNFEIFYFCVLYVIYVDWTNIWIVLKNLDCRFSLQHLFFCLLKEDIYLYNQDITDKKCP